MVKKVLLTAFILAVILTVWLNGKSKESQGIVAGLADVEANGKAASGLILPHHRLADPLIQRALLKISQEKTYTNVVILSPNHYFPDSFTFTTAYEVEGRVMDGDMVSTFLDEFADAKSNQDLVVGEHGISLILEYLEHFFPEVRVLPLVVSARVYRGELEAIANWLKNKLPPDETLYIASIDFSHDTKLNEAFHYDQETLKLIREFDIQTILGLKDTHLDGPGAMVVFLSTMQLKGSTKWDFWEESHAALLTGSLDIKGTSYITGVFR